MLQLKTDKMLARSENGIGWLTFNQPERRNAISLAMWEALGDALEGFQQDVSVRVVVMCGAGGKAFVSGADISEFDQHRNNAEQKERYAAIAARGNRWLRILDKPLIAMIQGVCIGGGLGVALNADIRFATPSSRFGIPAAKLGLGYEYPGIAALARLVGPSHARDILFSARFLSAEEALRIGLINFVVSDDELETKVREYAALISANAPLTLRASKAAVNTYERGGKEPEVAVVEAMVNACFDSEDYREGRKAFAEKRKPNFKGT